MRLAAIDIGTNSTRLLICDTPLVNATGKTEIIPLKREMQITRLGKDIEKTHKIAAKPAKETLEVLKRYAGLMRTNSVEKYRAVGTRALRLAKNADLFISDVMDATGIEVRKISGEQEAELSFRGVLGCTNAGSVLRESILVLDIGGGSTELILGSTEGHIIFSRSIEDGSVSVTEKYLDREKPTGSDIEKVKNYIELRFRDAMAEIHKMGSFLTVVGLAGTITTLAAVDLKLTVYDRDKIHGYLLKLDRVNELLNSFCSISLKERKHITGLDPGRADIIIGGSIILIKLMEMLNRDEVLVSESDILDGIIYSILQFC